MVVVELEGGEFGSSVKSITVGTESDRVVPIGFSKDLFSCLKQKKKMNSMETHTGSGILASSA